MGGKNKLENIFGDSDPKKEGEGGKVQALSEDEGEKEVPNGKDGATPSSTQRSLGMDVGEAVSYIRNTPKKQLRGFLSPDEDRKTVQEPYWKKLGIEYSEADLGHPGPPRNKEDSGGEDNGGRKGIQELRDEQATNTFSFTIYPIDKKIIEAVVWKNKPDLPSISQRYIIQKALDKLFEGQEDSLLKVLQEYERHLEKKAEKKEDDKTGERLL